MLNKNKIYKTKFVSMHLNDFKNQFIDNITNGKFRINHYVKHKMLQNASIFYNIFQYINWFKFYKSKNLKY